MEKDTAGYRALTHKCIVIGGMSDVNDPGGGSYLFLSIQLRQYFWACQLPDRRSHKGNCLDNAVAENFFGLLKSELLYLQKFQSMKQFKQDLIDYLDYYNNKRIKTKRKSLLPAIHKQQALPAA